MDDSFHKSISNIYLVLGYIVLLQDTLLPDLYVFRLLVSFSFLGISIYYWLYSNVTYKLPIFLKSTNLLLLLFTVYGLKLWFSGEILIAEGTGQRVSNATFIISCYTSLLPIYAFYSFSKKKLISYNKLENIIKVLFWIVIFNYVAARIIYSHSPGHGSIEEFTNNVSYACVALLPLLVVIKNKPRIYYFYFIVLNALIVISMKRGAILIAAILSLLLVLFNLGKHNKSSWLKSFIIIFGLLAIGYLGINYFISNNSFAQERVELTKDGYTSGRDIIYEQLFLHLSMVSKEQLWWGGGAWYTLNVTTNYAHSDWLEIAVDEGLFGVILYAIFWISFIVDIVKSKGSQMSFRILLLFFIIYFIRSIISMSYSEMGFVAGIGIGFFLGEATPSITKIKVRKNEKNSLLCSNIK